jgi:hypothetical protein
VEVFEFEIGVDEVGVVVKIGAVGPTDHLRKVGFSIYGR